MYAWPTEHVAELHRADRGMAGRPVPGCAGAPGRYGPRRASCWGCRSPGTTGSWPTTCSSELLIAASRRAGVVPDPDGGAGPDVRAAVRRGPGHDRLGRGAGVAGGVEPSRWSRWTADGEWYRYHHLFRDLLRAELERREPELVPELHRRAAVWCEANGLPEMAIDHAQAAGDADRVARLVLKLMQPVWASGRVDTVLRWMEWFEREQPDRAVPGGRRARRLDLRAARPAGRGPSVGRRPPNGPPRTAGSPTAARWRATSPTCGPSCAATAWPRCGATHGSPGTGSSPLSPYRATMLHTEGLSFLLDGDAERADAIFARAFDAAIRGRCAAAGRRGPGRALHHRRSRRDDWAAAAASPTGRLEIIRGGQFDDYWTSALVYAWAASVAAVSRQAEAGPRPPGAAAGLRPLLTHALPVVSVQALLELARAYIALADPDGARAVLRHADDILQQRPDLGVLPAQADELRAKLDTITDRPRRIVADHRRAAPAAAAGHPPQLPGDRRAPVRLAAHGEDPGHLDLPQARRLLPQRGGRPCPAARPARPVGWLATRCS